MSKLHGRENDTVEVLNDVPKSDVALREEAILAFWQEQEIFKKSLETPAGAAPVGDFVFYDGPPFATGLPHYGHILAGTIKDAIPRFWTMNGYRVERTWGWDCHGLPLENLIEKELGLGTKRDIEEYGVKNFNEKARGAVMRYADDWRKIVPRMGRFVDMEKDYKTMDSTYTESVWWVFKSLFDKGLVYEGFKSMHLCPRCGTTLSNFEVNQGYKDIKDIAVTVKLPLLDDAGNPTNTSLLVWTTTPWTLPGNMAAAVNQDFDYVKAKVLPKVNIQEITEDYEVQNEEFVIIAKGMLEKCYSETLPRCKYYAFGDHWLVSIEEMKGTALVGKKYQPPFDYLKNYLENSRAKIAASLSEESYQDKLENGWKIWHADYVELGEEGTGAVHIAPAYGDDDLKLAQTCNFPIYHHVTKEGKFEWFIDDDEFGGDFVKTKDDEVAGINHVDADIKIRKALDKKQLLFKKENITHSYPHCWRCDTPLLNYATTSWFVRVTDLKDKLVAANDNVKWVPEHVGTNRFGKWLEGARDWAISRQRYWGAPLPIWRNPATKEFKVFGSLAELQQYVPKSGNTYILLRHGEAQSNVEKILNSDMAVVNPLTATGVEQTLKAAKELPRDVDYIYYSPFQRTRETAEILAKELGCPSGADERLRESGAGGFEGQPHGTKDKFFSSTEEEFTNPLNGIETLNEVRGRVGGFLYEMEEKHQGKKILIVSHGDPIWMIETVMLGLKAEQSIKILDKDYPKNAQVRVRNFIPLPHNDYFELDFHRPYIDDIVLMENGVQLERVPDVFDCWFESGSMPYAQHHFMGEDSTDFQKSCFPAQFIAEGVDQTRGWFYSLMVLGIALFEKSPYQNVIVNGLVLAEDGKKMSKSLKNYPDPMELANRTGVDAMRFYLLSSPVIKGEDLNFSEKEVLELQRKNVGRLHNVLAMYEMFADGTPAKADSTHVLDRWILARLQELVNEATTGYKNYELDKAVRPITDFIDDLSVWYLRRSRDRFKGDNEADKTLALATLRYTLRTLALVMAPVMPFYAEYLWQAVKEDADAESVHLGKWPEEGEADKDLLVHMSSLRNIITFALEARTKAGIRVRQPLAKLLVASRLIANDKESVLLIRDEVNVKEVLHDSTITTPVELDLILTPELIAEGAVRELMRAVQGKRKSENLEPHDDIALTIATDDSGKAAIEASQDLLVKTVGAATLEYAGVSGEVVEAGEYRFEFVIKKI